MTTIEILGTEREDILAKKIAVWKERLAGFPPHAKEEIDKILDAYGEVIGLPDVEPRLNELDERLFTKGVVVGPSGMNLAEETINEIRKIHRELLGD